MRRFFKNLTDQQIEIGLYALSIAVLIVVACLVLWSMGPVWHTIFDLVGAVLQPLAYGFMLSYMLNPLVARVSHMLRKIKPLADQGERRRALAVLITVGLVGVIFLGVFVGFAFMVASGISTVDWTSVEAIFAEATEDIMGFIGMVRERLVGWGILNSETESTVVTAFVNVGNFASTLLFSIMFTIYFLLDGDRLIGYFHRVLFNVLGERSGMGSILLDDADRVFSGYFRGQAIDAIIVWVLTTVTLTIVGVPHAPVIGLLTGLGNLIPYVGGPVGYGSIIIICLAEKAWYQMALGIVAMAVVTFVDGNIINPRLLSDAVEVHPMLVAAALIAGGAIGGIAGMLVAVPTAAWLKIQLDRWMEANEADRERSFDEVASKGEE